METEKDLKDNEVVEEVVDEKHVNENEAQETASKTASSKEDEQVEKTFTQSQVNRMMTREKNQGRAAVLKDLGVDPKDDKALEMIKDYLASKKSDEQKAAELASAEQAKLQEAEERALVAEAKAEAMMLGVKTQYVDDIITLSLAKMSDESDLKTIIGEFKSKYSNWFNKDDDNDKTKKGQKGTGSPVKVSDKDSKETKKGLGTRLAAQRKTSNKKTSYWGK